jgi:hypothetical protein
MYELHVRETYDYILIWHFRIIKTLEVLHKYFYRPNVKRDVQRIYDRCITCKQAKSKVMPYGLYTSLLVPKEPWVDIFIDFILSIHRSRKGKDSIFVVVDRFSKMIHFISCHKTDDAMNITNLFFRKVVQLYGISRSIVFDRDVKFLSYFWKIL